VKTIGMVREQTEVSLILVLGLDKKTVICGRPNKFALLNSPKINTLSGKLSPFPLGISELNET
jgi:hypothetical protein